MRKLVNHFLVVGANAGVTSRGFPLEPDPTTAACAPGIIPKLLICFHMDALKLVRERRAFVTRSRT